MADTTEPITSLKRFSAGLRAIGNKALAIEIAKDAAAAITAAARATFEAGETPYHVPWRPGYDGQRVTLRESGALAKGIEYVAYGTMLRLRLGAKHAKYQVGRRPVTPRQDAPLPPEYVAAIKASMERTIIRILAPGGA